MDLTAVWNETQRAVADAVRGIVVFAVNAAQAVAVAIVAIWVARLVRGRLTAGLLRVRADPNAVAIAGNAAVVGVYLLAALAILALLGGNWTALVAVLGAGTVAISLALQDVLRSFVAGLYLLVERPFAIGDRIKVGDVDGRVRAIELRTTILDTDAGERVLVPNSTVFASVVTNRSAASFVPLSLTLSSVQESPAVAEAAILDALADLHLMLGATPEVEIAEAGRDGFTFAVRLRLRPEVDPSRLVARLHARFPDASLTLAKG